jgi:hypothetical protein
MPLAFVLSTDVIVIGMDFALYYMTYPLLITTFFILKLKKQFHLQFEKGSWKLPTIGLSAVSNPAVTITKSEPQHTDNKL